MIKETNTNLPIQIALCFTSGLARCFLPAVQKRSGDDKHEYKERCKYDPTLTFISFNKEDLITKIQNNIACFDSLVNFKNGIESYFKYSRNFRVDRLMPHYQVPTHHET